MGTHWVIPTVSLHTLYVAALVGFTGAIGHIEFRFDELKDLWWGILFSASSIGILFLQVLYKASLFFLFALCTLAIYILQSQLDSPFCFFVFFFSSLFLIWNHCLVFMVFEVLQLLKTYSNPPPPTPFIGNYTLTWWVLNHDLSLHLALTRGKRDI